MLAQEAAGSKGKNGINHNTEGSMSFMFPWILLAKSYRGDARWFEELLRTQLVWVTTEGS